MIGWVVAAAVAAGLACGAAGLVPAGVVVHLDALTTVALGVLLFGIGIEIGQSRDAWRVLHRAGPRILLIPAGIAAGSIAGGIAAGWLVGVPLRHAGAVGAGLGWYSLSGVMLARLVDLETGALAFLSNVMRELLAILITPAVARYFGRAAAAAPGGATTMDVTLGVVARAAGPDAALVAFLSGAVLSGLVPILVTLLARP